jgi:hypothetical protein
LQKLIESTSEKSQFDDAIRLAKKKGFSKKGFIEGAKGLQLKFQMEWMLEPVTSERSASLKRDIAKSDRLMGYAERNW